MIITLAFVVLVVARIPAVLLHGRFWAEESVVYFAAAWDAPWIQALFTIHTGYLNIAASSATLLALHLTTLEHAPQITAMAALFVQTLPAVLLATSRIPWLSGNRAYGVALILLLIPIGDAEVWLNSITSQFHMALCVGLILACEIRTGWVGGLRNAMLLLAPLAGPVSGALAPVFLLRAALDRSGARLLQTILLGLPTLLQTVIVLTHPEPARADGVSGGLLAAVVGVQHVVLPFAGNRGTAEIADAAAQVLRHGGVPVLAVGAGVLGIGGLGVALWRWGDRAGVWLFAAGVVLAGVSWSAALTLGEPLNLLVWLGCRYAYAPSVLFSLGLLSLAVIGPLPGRLLPAGLMLWMIGVGTQPYFEVPRFYAKGANWADEVAAWRRNPSHPLQPWPLGFTPQLTLDPKTQR